MSDWTFLTNHAQALLCIAHDPGARLIDIAAALGVTERSAYAIVNDLTNAGYVVKERDGRRNRYEVQGHLPLPGPVVRSATVGEVLAVLIGDSGAVAPVARRKSPIARRKSPLVA
jgi:DNA-binding transcriptional ArsR family regulator